MLPRGGCHIVFDMWVTSAYCLNFPVADRLLHAQDLLLGVLSGQCFGFCFRLRRDRRTLGMALVEALAHALTVVAGMGVAVGQLQLPLHDLIPQAQLLGLHLAH